jgi:glycosyltransferase involved in cell wall biosynthesis
MKVILLCSNYEPGGAQRVSIRLNNELIKRNIDSQNWFFIRKGNNFSLEPRILIGKKKITILTFLLFIYRLFKLLKNEKPDIVLTFLPYANIFGTIVAMLCGIKVRIASHRNECDQELSKAIKYVDKYCANHNIYTSITAVSNATKQTFQHYNKPVFDSIKVIHNGLAYNNSNLTQSEAKNKFDFTSQYIIGNVGRLVHQKNQTFLIDILKRLPDVELVIVGNGELKNELLAKVKNLHLNNRFRIIEELDVLEIPDFFKAIDLFIMPSLFEGLSNSLIEALHASKPIIASDVPSQREVLYNIEANYYAGELLDLSNIDLWVDSIIKIKNDELYRQQLMFNAHRRSIDFSINKMTDNYLSLLSKK